MADLKPLIAKLADGASLSADETAAAFDVMMSGDATPGQIGGLLMALRVRGETVEEISGAARTMRAKALSITAPEDAVDTCGTGGDAKGTYNISTCAAFVVAGAGVPVAKHGNRSVSSKSGSADVLAALGVNLEVGADVVERAIADVGIGFLFAPAHHAAMRHVGPTRAELGTRTIFNLLGPLANPAGTTRQVIGVFSADWLAPMAEVAGRLGAEHVWVVHGSDGLDELTTTGPSQVAAYRDGGVHTFEVSPADAGLAIAAPEALQGGDAAENADAIREVLAGSPSPFRDIVVLNAAAALIVAGRAETLAEAAPLAAQSIETGAATAALKGLVEITNG